MVGFRSEGAVVAGGREAAAKEDDLDGTHLLLLLWARTIHKEQPHIGEEGD